MLIQQKPPSIAFDGFRVGTVRLATSDNPFSIYYNSFVKMSDSGKNFSLSKEDELMTTQSLSADFLFGVRFYHISTHMRDCANVRKNKENILLFSLFQHIL